MRKSEKKLQNTNIAWYGSVPADWKLMRLKDTVEGCVNGIWGEEPSNDETDTPVIRVADFDRGGRIVQAYETVRSVPRPQKENRILEKGDLLIEKSGGGDLQPVGMVVEYQGPLGAVCSNFVARMRPRDQFDGRFLTYLHAHLYERSVSTISIKQSTGIQNLDSASYLGEKCFMPSLQEQLAIANYLDSETKRIDGLIEEKLKLKELLIELRAATISEVILGGKKSKDGQLSIQWEKTRLKYFASMQSGNAITSEFIEEEGQYPVYGGNGLRGYAREYTHEGDHILIGRQGALCGNVHLVEGKFWASEHAVVVTLYKGDNSRWAQYLLGQMNLGQYSIASAQPGLAVDRIKELEVLRPPVEEQLAIAKHLDEETKRIDELVAHVDSEIELLKELRASTITDAVLGHIDVRQAAKH